MVMHRYKWLRFVITMSILLTSSSLSQAGSYKERSIATEVGLGVGSVFLSLFYSPVKIFYSALGGTIGGLAYLVTIGNTEVALSIIEPTCRGDYIITPAILSGEAKLEFIGHRRRSSDHR